MGRCNLDTLLDMVGEKKLTKEEEVTFSLHSDLPDCRKIDAKSYVEASGTPTYNRFARPKNRFECLRSGCSNSGTLTLSVANETVLYHAKYDATEFAAGVMTFYVKADDKAPVAVTVKIADDKALTNADVYTVTIAATDVTDDGFAPVFIDLSSVPSSETGEGWTATRAGAYIQISADKVVGFSSISLFESIFDFEVNDAVKVSCLTEIGGSFDVDALEATCLQAGYDDSLSSLEYTVTGNKVTPNYWKLNPLLAKGDKTEGYFPVTTQKVVESFQNGAYGYVRLADANQDECGYFNVQIADECNFTDAYLAQLSIPVLANIDEGHYIIIRNEDGTTDIVVNKALIGMSLKIGYPISVEIESEMVAHTDNLNGVRVRMTVPRTYTDGGRYLLIFDNVLITSFPATINNEETEFSFTITIQRDKDGVFFRRQKISTANVTSPTYQHGHI